MIPRIVKILYENIKNTSNNQVFILILNTGLATKTGSLVPDAISLNNYSEISVKQTGNVVNVQFILQNNGSVFLTEQFSPCSITGVALPRVALTLTLGNAYSSRDRWIYDHVCYAVMGNDGKIYVKVSTANELFVFVNFTYIV